MRELSTLLLACALVSGALVLTVAGEAARATDCGDTWVTGGTTDDTAFRVPPQSQADEAAAAVSAAGAVPAVETGAVEAAITETAIYLNTTDSATTPLSSENPIFDGDLEDIWREENGVDGLQTTPRFRHWESDAEECQSEEVYSADDRVYSGQAFDAALP